MGGKIQKVYDALIDGAGKGLVGEALYHHVLARVPKATSKRIVKASLFALTDPDVKDLNILKVIFDLAITHRLDPKSPDDADERDQAPKKRERLRKKAAADQVGDTTATSADLKA